MLLNLDKKVFSPRIEITGLQTERNERDTVLGPRNRGVVTALTTCLSHPQRTAHAEQRYCTPIRSTSLTSPIFEPENSQSNSGGERT